jgi:small subunit ribosomal protein S9
MATTRYVETVGRRKTASARVRVTPAAKSSVQVNGKTAEDFFPTAELRETALAPLKGSDEKFGISVLVRGGGISGQAEAMRHGLARALTEHDASKRTALKKLGYLKRDPRAKERRKPGLKKARKAGQWSKR